MSTTFEDSLLDFDINFLQPSVNASESRIDKQRRQILITKKKAIAIDALIKKFYAQREKWEQNEVVLLTAKEECKQVCINYQDALEKCTKLEKDIEILCKQNAELNLKHTTSENQYEGLKSHANQLQQLVREHESIIEALKVEKHLEKNNSEDYEANVSTLQKENKGLLKHLRILNDIALGKKKLRNRHKELLRKYDFKEVSSEDSSSSDDSCEEPDFFDDPPQSPLSTSLEESAAKIIEQNILKPYKTEIAIKKDSITLNEDNDSNYSNEVVSEDTGCGSSLAFSDGDKCFSSPDYFNNDSPENIPKQGKTNKKSILMDSGTSPIKSHKAVHVATSPLIFDDVALLTDSNTLFSNETDINSPEYYINEIPLSNEVVTIKEKRKLIDIATSPIKDIEKVNIATSPLVFEKCVEMDVTNIGCTAEDRQIYDVADNFTSNISSRQAHCVLNEDSVNLSNTNGKNTVIDNLEGNCELEISGKSIEERKCLERNNSKNVCDENSNDDEIDMILSTMRFNQKLITPIPDTPVKMHKNEKRKVQKLVENVSETSGDHSICRDSLLLREENKVLHKNIGDLKKDIMDIKCLLKDLLLGNNSKQICNERDKPVHIETFDDTSQEPTIIYNNCDNGNVSKETGVINLSFSNISNNELFTVTEANENNCTDNIIQTDNSFTHVVSKETPSFNVAAEKQFSVDLNSSLNNDVQVTKNDIREAITYEEDIRSDTESDIIILNNDHTTNNLSPGCSSNKKKKNKKLSKLDKFKKKLQPKSKISKAIRKTPRKYKLRPLTKITEKEATAILNNKSVYENAAKVLAEINLKEKRLDNKKRLTRNTKKAVEHNVEIHNDRCLEQPLAKQNIGLESNDQQDLIDKNIRPTDVELKNLDEKPSSPITTRSRSRKLSISSPVHTDTLKKDSFKKIESEQKKKITKRVSDSTMDANKRVLRSSNNRNTFVDSDCAKKAVLNENENVISDTSYNKRKRDSRDEKQNISGNGNSVNDAHKASTNKIMPDTRIRNRKRKLSNNNDEKQNLNDVSLVPNQIHDRRLSKIENLIQNGTHNIKNVCVVLNKIEDHKLFQNEKPSITGSNTSHNIRDHDFSSLNRKTQRCTKNVEDNNVHILDSEISHPKQSILCKMLEKHGRGERKSPKQKVPDNVTNKICKKLEESIASINELPIGKIKLALNKLVDEVQSWELKHFMSGFMAYLKNPDRKTELYNKVTSPPAPAMTKSEQVVLYIVRQMEIKTPNTVNMVLTYIEFSLFQLNRTPEFEVIESLSHFYALLCRYFGLKSRLRLFLLDAMYCLQFKVVPLIKQCLDVWMHILPLAHMGIAKSPLVTCLVYLLHFYKCEDRFNRVKEIRSILNQKYFYKFGDWNEPKILEMFRNAIKEIRDIPLEKKMLRMALILLGKRHGPKWCHKNIIKNMLMPMIESEVSTMKMKQFCVQMMGALLKPFPADMKVDLEITINYMLDMLKQNPPHALKEAIFTSLIYVNHHNPGRVTRELLMWMPKEISPELETLLRDYVRTKKLNMWKVILSKITM